MNTLNLVEAVNDIIDWLEDGHYDSAKGALDALVEYLPFMEAEKLRRARVEVYYGDMKEAQHILNVFVDKLMEDPNA